MGNATGLVHAVGTSKPNAWGLYDMYGHELEKGSLSQDDQRYRDEVGKNVQVRLGGDATEANSVGFGERDHYDRAYQNDFFGLRVVAEVE